MEIGDAVLDEQADEIETAYGEFTLGVREDGTVQSVSIYEQRTEQWWGCRKSNSPVVIVECL